MPNFQKHLISGVVVGVVLYAIFRDLWVAIMATIYSTLPDLDIGTSIPFRFYAIMASGYAIYMLVIQQTFYSNLWGYAIPQRYFAIPPLLGLIILQFVPHREWLHSISAGLIFSIPLWFFLGWQVCISGLLGYYTHLLLDNELFDGLFT